MKSQEYLRTLGDNRTPDLNDSQQPTNCCQRTSIDSSKCCGRGPELPHSDYADGFYKNLLDNLYDAVYFVDRQRRITYWNYAAEQLTGYSAAETLGRCCSDNLLMHTDQQGVRLCLHSCPLTQSMADGVGHEAEVFLRHKQGHRIPVSVRITPIINQEGGIVGSVEVFSDNSAKSDAEERALQLEQLTFFDPVTRIANRRFLEFRLGQMLEELQRYGHVFGLILFDLDHFKQVNDQHGHSIGDDALRVAAQTLTRTLRASDNVGRWGGDEFMAILPQVTAEALKTLAERCRILTEQSLVASPTGSVQLSISIGATLARLEDSPEGILERVDGNLYRSKRLGKNRVTLDE